MKIPDRSPFAQWLAIPVVASTLLASAVGAQTTDTSIAHGNGKLLLTGGVSSIDGAAGGGLTPWAVTGGYATNNQFGATASISRATTQDYGLTTFGVTATVHDRIEVSLARQEFNASVVAPGATLKQDILGIKLKIAGDAVLDSDTWMPQIAVGAEFKHVDPGDAVGGVLNSVDAKRSGVDLYVSATKLFLAQSVLVNGTLRATKANQNGLLGFGSSDNSSYRFEPEVSLAYLLRRDLAVGAEYRRKPNNLEFAGAAFREDDWKDLFIAWSQSKNVSITAAYVDLGNIVGHKHQAGAYVSLQLAY